jgi:DNA-binding MarR family transcriptional regulator
MSRGSTTSGNGSMNSQPAGKPQAALGDEDYRTLAAFRHALRQFLTFSEAAAHEGGMTTRQHQAILAIRSRAPDPASISDIAAHLMIRHHSAVELIDRLEKAGLVKRSTSRNDKRRVLVRLTPRADAVLKELAGTHLTEIVRIRPLLLDLAQRLEHR